MHTLACPTCAALIEAEASGGATCPYCGTESHRRARETSGDREIPAPEVIPPAPPADLPMERWSFEQWIGTLLREEDPGRRLVLAGAMPAFGEEHLVWAPVLAEMMIEADERLDLALGRSLARLAGTWKSVALRGQVLRVVRARLPRLQHSPGVIVALEGVGVAGLKTLLALAERADERGDEERVAEKGVQQGDGSRGLPGHRVDAAAGGAVGAWVTVLTAGAVKTLLDGVGEGQMANGQRGSGAATCPLPWPLRPFRQSRKRRSACQQGSVQNSLIYGRKRGAPGYYQSPKPAQRGCMARFSKKCL